ncbi:MAG TPA: hypothetical protein VIV40_16505 [Kofleriaceae bacterium]
MARWPLVLPFVTLFASQPAWALQPAKHRELAEAACTGVGLPPAYCHRMGKAAFETDWHEWTNLAAHAQRELGEDRCTAADAALTRVDRLAREAVAKTRAGDAEGGAIALGRAIHTLQDECAHHGMTNQEHAFYSLTQACTDQDASPDVQPEAIACATTRTRDAFAAVASALAGTQWTSLGWLCRDSEDRDTCQSASLPGPWNACSFLAEHEDWDGEDSRWDGSKVGSALMSAFGAGLSGGSTQHSACGSNPAAIDPADPRAPTTNLEAGCTLIDIACLGKVDEDHAAETESTGCSTGRGTGIAMLLALGLLLGRKRCTDS